MHLGADEATNQAGQQQNDASSAGPSVIRSLLWGTLLRSSMPAVHDISALQLGC